jgi:hypothetical protein
VLRLWNRRTHIWLAPDRVVIVRFNGRWQPAVTARRPSALQTAGDAYAAVLEALELGLKETDANQGKAVVVLDSRFARHAVFPRDTRLAGREELLAYAQHCMRGLYGEAALGWAVEFAESGPNLVVSAVDRALLERLVGVLGRFKLSAQSITPYLAHVFNRFRGQLREEEFWFAVADLGSITLCRVGSEYWQSIRRYAIAGNPSRSLAEILDRERNVDLSDVSSCPLYLYAPMQPKLSAPPDWDVRRLESPQEGMRDPALALCLAN